ncbi:MAG: hypothetical protein ACJAUP_002557 [Cellvibrionaceae bacterium]|jgi:hypothetical protein
MILLARIRFIAISARLIGSLFKHHSKILVSLYDFMIMLPLAIESVVKNSRSSANNSNAKVCEKNETYSLKKLAEER